MPTGQLKFADDVSAGAWIAPRVTGRGGTVSDTVPGGDPAYVRICPPATDRGGSWASSSQPALASSRWADAARILARGLAPASSAPARPGLPAARRAAACGTPDRLAANR